MTYAAKLLSIESLVEQVEELAAEDAAQGFNREQRVFTGRSPAFLIGRQTSRGEQTMELKMIQQGLIPGMQHGDETELSAQPRMATINERSTNGFKQMT